MTWHLVARKDVGDAVRSRTIHGIAGLLAFVFGVVAYYHTRTTVAGGGDPTEALLGLLMMVATVIVPAVGLMLVHESIAGKRADGRLKLLLGQPHTRLDVVVGSYLGRTVVLATSLLIATGAVVAVASARGAEAPLYELAMLLGFTTLLAGAYAGIGICISSLTRSTTWAATLAFGVFLLFLFVWRMVPLGLAYAINGFELPPTQPEWTTFVATLSPSVAYERAVEAFVVGREVTDSSAAYLDPTAAVAVLVAWCVLWPAIGYLQFRRSDL